MSPKNINYTKNKISIIIDITSAITQADISISIYKKFKNEYFSNITIDIIFKYRIIYLIIT